MPENYRFGGGVAETSLNPIVLAGLLVATVCILVLPRRLLVVPFLLIGLLVPSSQVLIIAGFHLFVIRMIILAGCMRMIFARFRGEALLNGGATVIDSLFMCWAFARALAFTLLYREQAAVVNQCAALLDSLGGYFFLRYAIHDEEDIVRAMKTFALIAIIVSLGMANEQISSRNIFGLIGGQPDPAIREGRLRSQGPFSHAILAGVFGATIFPLFLRLWSAGKDRLLATAGIIGAMVMVLTSASSTPIGALIAGLVAICFWPLRRNMRAVRWSIVLAIVVLAMVMKAPVWFLLAHIDLVGGASSGYHRAMLVDSCIRRFADWWLLGANSNQDWGWDMWDIQNQFVAEALRGGLAAFVLFVMVIARTFGSIGYARWSMEGDRRQEWSFWLLGAAMVSHLVAFLGADYFDQTRFWWYTTLAFVGAATQTSAAENDEYDSSAELGHSRFQSSGVDEDQGIGALSGRGERAITATPAT